MIRVSTAAVAALVTAGAACTPLPELRFVGDAGDNDAQPAAHGDGGTNDAGALDGAAARPGDAAPDADAGLACLEGLAPRPSECCGAVPCSGTCGPQDCAECLVECGAGTVCCPKKPRPLCRPVGAGGDWQRCPAS